MNIKTKFNVGDTCYFIEQGIVYKAKVYQIIITVENKQYLSIDTCIRYKFSNMQDGFIIDECNLFKEKEILKQYQDYCLRKVTEFKEGF